MGKGVKDTKHITQAYIPAETQKEYLKRCEKARNRWMEKKAERDRWEKAMRSIINL